MTDPTTQMILRAKTGDKQARDTLVEENLGLVHYIVKRFLNRGYDPEDLFQIGCIGLMKAIDQFDTELGVKLSTYAVPLITGEIKRFLRDDGLIKVSRSLKENGYHIRKAEEVFVQKYNRKPTVEELKKETGLSGEEIVMALEANVEVESIYRTVCQSDGNEVFLIDQISQNGQAGRSVKGNGDEEKDRLLDKLLLKELLDRLDDSEQEIIRLRFFEELTQTEIAKKLGMNQVQVCRLEKKIVQKMRQMVSAC